MKEYVVHYSCPFCPNPCCTDWEGDANEMVGADNKSEARKLFNNAKQCRYMKVTRIEEYNPGIKFISAEVNGKKYNTLEEAIEAAIKYHDFCDDEEKMADFWILTKEEFLLSYSYLTEEEYDLTVSRVKNSSERV